MFLEETLGGRGGLIRDLVATLAEAQDGALATPYLPYRKVSWLLTPHYLKRDPSAVQLPVQLPVQKYKGAKTPVGQPKTLHLALIH